MPKGFEEFVVMAKNNPAVLQEMTAFEGQSYDAAGSGIVALGAKHGFEFSEDDVIAALDEAVSNRALESEELSDEDLELVAGGKGGGGEAALVLIGVIGDVVDNTTD
jgi:hypothetical protein